MKTHTSFVVALACWAVGVCPVSGQTLEDVVRAARAGDTIVVTDTAGGTVKGTLVSASRESIRILSPTPKDIFAADVVQVDRIGDPNGDGFRKGAIAGAVVGKFFLGQGDFPYSLLKVSTGAIEFGLFGLLFDWMHTARTTVYRAGAKGAAVQLTPLAAPGRRGVALSVRF